MTPNLLLSVILFLMTPNSKLIFFLLRNKFNNENHSLYSIVWLKLHIRLFKDSINDELTISTISEA